MRTITIVLALTLLPGCTVLAALGLGVKDLAPSLQHCRKVQYDRVGIDVKINAECTVPAG